MLRCHLSPIVGLPSTLDVCRFLAKVALVPDLAGVLRCYNKMPGGTVDLDLDVNVEVCSIRLRFDMWS